MQRQLIQQTGWFFAFFFLFVGCIWISWLTHAKADYGFQYWYSYYDIESHIDKYGPKNRFKPGLDKLEPEEHIQLFGEISRSVHQHGKGLADIRYEYRGKSRALLRQPEVVHLQDVANLIDIVRPAGFFCLLAGALLGFFLLRNQSRPRARDQLAVGLGLSLIIAALFALIGPKEIFYQLHVWVFPDDHQWFFYYQESLMATLMKAPILFGGISASIAIGGVLIFLSLFFLMWKFRSRLMGF